MNYHIDVTFFLKLPQKRNFLKSYNKMARSARGVPAVKRAAKRLGVPANKSIKKS